MTIVQVMPEFGLAGAETMCENLIYELTKLGHNVVAVSMYDFHSAITERLENSGIDVCYLGKKLGLDFSMIPKMMRVFKKVNADVIHTHRNCAQYAVPAAMIVGIKRRVHTVHNIAEKENERMARVVNKFFFKHCHLIPVALSGGIRDSIVKEYKITRSRVPIIFNGINLSQCISKGDYSINGNLKVLHIGRFSEQKNHGRLLRAFVLFHNKHSDSELWLIGDGEKKTEIETFVCKNALSENVKFLGLQSDVHEFLREADIFVLPSDYEGMPMTIIEAMGTGLPCIASNVGGIPDMISNGVDGMLIEPNEGALVDAIESLYNDMTLRKKLGENAKKRAQSFSSEQMAREYIKVYGDCIYESGKQ